MQRRERLLFALGRPFGPLYGVLMRWRAALYRCGVFPSSRLPVPVVSIGNLTWGGTGKTPMVAAIAAFLRAKGRRPAVVSRGYGGGNRRPVLVVSDGEHLLAGPDEAGDEPCLLGRRLSGVPVVVARRRALGGMVAVERLGCDVVLLDDGFQHLALRRDLDIVLFRGADPLGNGRIFPAGPLREPFTALCRAGCFVLTGKAAWPETLARRLDRLFPAIPRYAAPLRPRAVASGDGEGATSPLAAIRGQRIVAFCGIADPGGFRRLLEEGGAELADWLVFPDHHRYQPADIQRIGQRLARTKAAFACTTEKDLVKIGRPPFPLVALTVELQPPAGLFSLIWRTVSKETTGR